MPYATVSDIKAHVPAPSWGVVVPDDVNVAKIEIAVERIIRGYLSRILSTATMAAWDTPEHTPELITEVAAMLEASWLLSDQINAASYTLDERNWAQVLYDRAILLLQGIVSGSIILDGVDVASPESMTDLDFFPIDDTDRAFTMSMQL